jgi:putative hydrolase
MKLIADTHTHTCASTHAYSTILENARVASEKGLLYLATTDHASGDVDAPHIWHFHNFARAVDRTLFDVKLLFGVECSIISADGTLNMATDDLKKLEWVIASVHFPVEGVTDYTDVYAAVAENDLVDVIGHSADKHFPYDYDKILPIFKEKHKLVEMNEGNITLKHKYDQYVTLAKKCMEYRVPVIVDSDAHFCNRIGDHAGAERILESINFPEELIVNASEETFTKYLKLRGKDSLWI